MTLFLRDLWIIPVSHRGRDEIARMRYGVSRDRLVDQLWDDRGQTAEPLRWPWPLVRGPQAALPVTVTQIRRVT